VCQEKSSCKHSPNLDSFSDSPPYLTYPAHNRVALELPMCMLLQPVVLLLLPLLLWLLMLPDQQL
jgi:hypothetical protein